MTTVGIVGGGIIGSAIGAWLAADGYDVTIFERDPAARPASAGNAGLLALPEISPLARPGTLASVPAWLMDPLGPLTLRWRDLPSLTPWMAAFLAAARPSKVRASTAALGALMKTALADHQELARRAGLSGHIRRTGAFHIYESEASFNAGMTEWHERARHGVDYQEVTPTELREIVPVLRGAFSRALFAPDYWTVSSPAAILEALRERVSASGRIAAKTVVEIVPDANSVAVITSDGGDLPFDRVVIAGGVWSRDLVRRLGLKVRLETERGYNTTYALPPFDWPVPIFFADHGFIASSLADGLRVGGAVELAEPEAPPNFARAAAMRAKMRRLVPELPEAGGAEWMGCRPSTPELDPRHRRLSGRPAHPHGIRPRPYRPDALGRHRPPCRRARRRPHWRSGPACHRDRALPVGRSPERQAPRLRRKVQPELWLRAGRRFGRTAIRNEKRRRLDVAGVEFGKSGRAVRSPACRRRRRGSASRRR